jgi:NADPH-dependent curcumin reductase CurA
MRNANRRFVLKARPEGIAGPEHFTEEAVAVRSPEPGEVLLETMYVSVDPAMRVWVSGNPGYVPRVEIGEVMRAGGIARVVESRAAGFAAGDLVRASVGWQSHPTLPAQGIQKLDLSLGGPLDWLGLLGLTGKPGYFGMREVGAVRPGETVLVSGAAGGVGQIAGRSPASRNAAWSASPAGWINARISPRTWASTRRSITRPSPILPPR